MLNSAKRREEVAGLSRILTIKRQSFHMLSAPCISFRGMKLQEGKDLYQLSQSWSVSSTQLDGVSQPSPPPLVDPLVGKTFRKRPFSNKRESIHDGETLFYFLVG